jgi:uncharacterized membrane protein YfhO
MSQKFSDLISFKKLWPHLIAIVGFVIITSIYFAPVFQGKVTAQHDVMQAAGSQKEIQDYLETSGELTLWTNSMFGGMPTYQIWIVYPMNLIKYIMPYLKLYLPNPVGLVFLYFLGFYLMLLVLRVNPWLAFIGGVAYAFSSNNFIIIEAGHLNKALAIGILPMVVAGFFLVFQKKYFWGFIVTAVTLSLQLVANHLQITYYLAMMLAILMIIEFIYAIKNKTLVDFAKISAILVVAALFAVAVNITNLWVTNEYSKLTMRGGSELESKKAGGGSEGLEKSYALSWSYGQLETFTLLVPGFSGGSSNESLSTNSITYKTMIEKGVGKKEAKNYIKTMPVYWGPQAFTAGPIYLGAIIFFLFVFGLILIKGKMRSWLLSSSILGILLCWGIHFEWFTDIFFYNFPLYNKFRAVSMILILPIFAFPLMAIMAVNEVINGTVSREEIIKALKYSLYSVGGLVLLFAVAGSALFSFDAASDQDMIKNGNDWVVDALKSDRIRLMRLDSLRSFVLIALFATSVYLFIIKKIKSNVLMVILGVLVLFDLWGVDKRYFNGEDFVKEKTRKAKYFTPSAADSKILQDKDPYYRVLNLSTSPFNDAITSYFHKSIGGYSGVKLARYQDLIDKCLYPEIQLLVKDLQTNGQINPKTIPVLNMLNTRYLKAGENENTVFKNEFAFGNAWFVNDYKLVDNTDQEIKALDSFDLRTTAIIDKKFSTAVNGLKIQPDSNATIKLTEYKPNKLTFKYKAASDQVAVFSDIYYEKGWKATLDGKPIDIFRSDYILRSLRLPAGEHQVVFEFRPASYYTGEKISLASSLTLILLSLGGIVYAVYRKLNPKQTA